MTAPESARDRLADAACEAAFHWHLDRENPSWRELWYRVVDAIADVALAQAREEVLAPFVALEQQLTEQEQRCRDEAARTRIIGEQAEWGRLADNLHDEAARVRRALAAATETRQPYTDAELDAPLQIDEGRLALERQTYPQSGRATETRQP